MAGLKVRLGYVANALRLPESSPSHTTTLSALQRLPADVRPGRLLSLARVNLHNTLRILKDNVCDDIQVYRLTSKLVPFATHPMIRGWNYDDELAPELAAVGSFASRHGLRLSAHPDHFTLLNSIRPEVLAASLLDLEYHDRIFNAMGLAEAELVIHIGGAYKDREKALDRFRDNYRALPENISRRLVLENDDRSFDAATALSLCEELGAPMVLDLHHFSILPGPVQLPAILPRVFNTWGERRPKFHYSSPRSAAKPRSHADYLEAEPFLAFLRLAVKHGREFDVMLEAKAKDLALIRLSQEIDGQAGVRSLSRGVLEVQS